MATIWVGDGVIVTARLEPLAESGGIVISSRLREDASGKITLEVDDLGEPPLKSSDGGFVGCVTYPRSTSKTMQRDRRRRTLERTL
jgi:class 3 adenylate cyclase